MIRWCWWWTQLGFIVSAAEFRVWQRQHYNELPLQHLSVYDLYTNHDKANSSEAEFRRALQETQAETQIVTPFTPLRFYFDTRVIESARGSAANNDAKIDRILNQILPAAAEFWSSHLSVQALTSSSSSSLSGISISNSTCSGIFAAYLTEEVIAPNADMVILVGGDPQNQCADNTLAFAAPCQLHPLTDRPIVGLMNFCLDQIPADGSEIMGEFPTFNDIDMSAAFSKQTGATFRQDHLIISLEEVTIHELTHALGQTSQLFVFFRDEFGAPRTPRDELGQPIPITHRCIDGSLSTGLLPANTTVQIVELPDGRIEQYIITPRVQTIARNHFRCPTLLGGRLSDDGMCVGNHWHERHHFADLLSPVVSDNSQTGLSLLTLALLEDSGWYQVDYRGGAQPGFGIQAGCAFLEENCIDGSTDHVPLWNANEFCDVPVTLVNAYPSSETLNHIYCDPTYVSWTICDLGPKTSFTGRTYFSDSRLAPLVLDSADACPIPLVGLGRDCRIEDASYTAFYPGESVGKTNSRCIGAYYEAESTGDPVYRPACISATCVPETKSVLIGDVTCSTDGEILPIPGQDGSFIICPRLATICPDMFTCPFGCFGRGECMPTTTNTNNNSSSGAVASSACRCFDETNTDPACKPPELIGPTSAPTWRPVAAPAIAITVAPSVPASDEIVVTGPPTPTLPTNPSLALSPPSEQGRPDSAARTFHKYSYSGLISGVIAIHFLSSAF